MPVHDSDEAVHRLYAGAAAPLVEAAFPGTVQDGVVDRAELARRVVGEPAALAAAGERSSIRWCAPTPTPSSRVQRAADAPLAVLDIPLLFETGGERPRRQDRGRHRTGRNAARAGARPAGHDARRNSRRSWPRQMPDAEKRARADFVIDTGAGLEAARQSVERVIATLDREKLGLVTVLHCAAARLMGMLGAT